MLAQFLAQFALLLIVGIAAMLCLMPRRDVASGFFRIEMLVVLGLSALLGLAAPDARLAAAFIGASAFVGSALWMLERRPWATGLLFAILGFSLAELFRTECRPVWCVSHLATSGTLGGTLTAMLLGHRYLTAPGMPLRPLHVLNAALGGAVLLRAGVSIVTLGGLSRSAWDPTVISWLALRWLAGIIGPAVAVVLVWRILKYRNTQSATGVLFAAVVLSFIGELAAALLAKEVGWPP